jgi:hypothetical protein
MQHKKIIGLILLTALVLMSGCEYLTLGDETGPEYYANTFYEQVIAEDYEGVAEATSTAFKVATPDKEFVAFLESVKTDYGSIEDYELVTSGVSEDEAHYFNTYTVTYSGGTTATEFVDFVAEDESYLLYEYRIDPTQSEE